MHPELVVPSRKLLSASGSVPQNRERIRWSVECDDVDRLWEHIEHLAPGLVLAILIFFGFSKTMAEAFPVPESVPRDPLLVGGAFVAFGYLLGVINSSLSRLCFADLVPLLDWLRWRHLARAVRNSPALNGAIADVRWGKDFDAIEAYVNAGVPMPWRSDSRVRRKRAVFSSIAGRAQTLGGALAAELAQRRREARLMRSTIFPAVAAGIYVAGGADFGTLFMTFVVVLLILVAYYSREISVVETFEAYAEALYEKKFRELGT